MLWAQEAPEVPLKGNVGFRPGFTYLMVEANQDLRKVYLMAKLRKEGALGERSFTLGGSLITLFDYQKSNTDSKFAYLMRHPTSNNQIGTTVTEAVVHSFQLSFAGAINNWIAAYAEILYNPEQSFGVGTITSLGRNQLQLRKGYVLLGDLNKFPLYGAIGKMDTPFSQTGSVNPFTNNSVWHAFGGLGFGAQISFVKWNLHATFMAVQGGSQFRALHTPVGDSTNVPSQINNFVADINYTIPFMNNSFFRFGGSYVHGSAYCQEFPVVHFKACSERNAAWATYGTLQLGEAIKVKGSFNRTFEVWPGTHNPTPPLDEFEASKVTSWDVGGRYAFNLDGKVNYAVSGEFSKFDAGPDDAPWERQNQIVVGLQVLIYKSSKFFVEFFRTDGYVPLNFISGGGPDSPFPPGTTHSVNGAFSHGIVVGAQLTL